MALRRHPDGKFDLKLYFRPNSRTFLFSALLDDYDYDAYITASSGERTVIRIFIEKNGNARAKESYAEIIKSHTEREAAEQVEQLASTVEKLSLGSEPQPSISIPSQSSKTLIMSTSSSVEIDPSKTDEVLFPYIFNLVDIKDLPRKRELIIAMPSDQRERFSVWFADQAQRAKALLEAQDKIEKAEKKLEDLARERVVIERNIAEQSSMLTQELVDDFSNTKANSNSSKKRSVYGY